MVSTFKMFALGFLCASAIVLGTAVVTMTVLLERRRSALLDRRRAGPPPSSGAGGGGGGPVRSSGGGGGPAEDPTETGGGGVPGGRRRRDAPAPKTVRPASPPDGSDLNLRRRSHAPDPSSPRTAADAHFASYVRLSPFESGGGDAGNANPAALRGGSSHGRESRRGADFVKLDGDEYYGDRGAAYGRSGGGAHGVGPFGSVGSVPRERGGTGGGDGRGGGVGRSGGGGPTLPPAVRSALRYLGVGPDGRIFASLGRVLGILGVGAPSPPESGAMAGDGGARAGGDGGGSGGRTAAAATRAERRAREAIFHLTRAAELGHPDAQHAVGNALASGVLPVDNSLVSGDGDSGGGGGGALSSGGRVPADFSEGGPSLARALTLWHAAAMGGNAEAAMNLGYRARYSAMGGRNDGMNIITDSDLNATMEGGGGTGAGAGIALDPTKPDAMAKLVDKKKAEEKAAARHPASPGSHYGVLGTCESALTYYEAAANAAMDEMESSPLRGKVPPAADRHRLAEIHMHGGASSALSQHNKPDELEEALQYYRMRARPDRRGGEPDVHAAYTLANFYHYGMRGVKQDMGLALKYYEIAADASSPSWEAAGQAGKFHLWGIGVEEGERDLKKAYRYFRTGAPGGAEGCARRLRAKRDRNRHRAKQRRRDQQRQRGGDDEYDDDEYDEEDEYDDDGQLCDHPCVNGLGLLHLMGVPDLIAPDVSLAKKYFALSRDMGNMDASYNLAMVTLGWMDGKLLPDEDEDYHTDDYVTNHARDSSEERDRDEDDSDSDGDGVGADDRKDGSEGTEAEGEGLAETSEGEGEGASPAERDDVASTDRAAADAVQDQGDFVVLGTRPPPKENDEKTGQTGDADADADDAKTGPEARERAVRNDETEMTKLSFREDRDGTIKEVMEDAKTGPEARERAVRNDEPEMTKLSFREDRDGTIKEVTEDEPAEAHDKVPPRTGPSKADYSLAFREFVKAANKGHLQAKHRLAALLARGVRVPDPRRPGRTDEVIGKNCVLALSYYRDIAEGGMAMGRRTRAAYKQYVAGDYDSSLRNYLAAAEAGSAVGQINAAFLLERGHCLGLGRSDCLRASVRLWRAAARQGNEEASLRVGDFYYYGRLSGEEEEEEEGRGAGGGASTSSGAASVSDVKNMERRRNASGFAMGPYPWIRYVIYPEDLIPVVKRLLVRGVRWALSKPTGKHDVTADTVAGEEGKGDIGSCPAGEEARGVCVATGGAGPAAKDVEDEGRGLSAPARSQSRDDHLAIAAQYYRRAAEDHESARANFNLGFMHEWGLGLKQDFPLAKRHYDLAAASRSGEAELAVQMALMAMNVHERVVRLRLAWEDWRSKRREKAATGRTGDDGIADVGGTPAPSPAGDGAGHPVPPGSPGRARKGTVDIVLSHLLTWESALILVLTLILMALTWHRMEQQR